MSIILLESPDSGESWQSSTQLVPMKDSKVSHSYWQLPIWVSLIFEDQAMAWAVHGLQPLSLYFISILLFHQVKVVSIVSIMAWNFPEVDVSHVRCYHLLVSSQSILVPQKFCQLVMNLGAVGQEERASWRVLRKEKQVLFGSNNPMVSLFSFFLHFQEFRQLLFLRKWDTVHSLQRFSLRITKPVRLRILCDFESLRILRGGNVRTCTKVNEISNLKHTCYVVFWNLVLNQLCLELIVLE